MRGAEKSSPIEDGTSAAGVASAQLQGGRIPLEKFE